VRRRGRVREHLPGWQAFGNSFLQKFNCAELPSETLKSMTFIDTPGVLSGEKQRIGRNYNMPEVCRWFADRSDLVLILFDAHKLDISDELKTVVEHLRGNDDKIRIVLNKADQITPKQLMRVYGALMWSLGKVCTSPSRFSCCACGHSLAGGAGRGVSD
jgi:predicted GTPase